jgi:transketolase
MYMQALKDEEIHLLEQTALKLRAIILQIAHDCPVGIHVGGSISIAEILTSLLFQVMRIDPQDPRFADRDRLILSKGHANAALVSALALRGYFPIDDLKAFDTLGSPYAMHADGHNVPGTEVSAGSLGHGLSLSVGMALAGRLDQASWHVYCILGDGEMMEGSVWEAMMSASHYGLDNLTAIVDRNRFSLDGPTASIMEIEPLNEKCQAFGWHVQTVNGHAINELVPALLNRTPAKPSIIIANTIKGHGVPSLENRTESHYARLGDEQLEESLAVIKSQNA